jgi:hypothetical protein
MYTIYTNIIACRVQQRYLQIIKFTQQHIIEYKSSCSSHTYILSRFLLTIFHSYYKQYSTHLTSASGTTLGLPSTPPVKLRSAGHTSYECYHFNARLTTHLTSASTSMLCLPSTLLVKLPPVGHTSNVC